MKSLIILGLLLVSAFAADEELVQGHGAFPHACFMTHFGRIINQWNDPISNLTWTHWGLNIYVAMDYGQNCPIKKIVVPIDKSTVGPSRVIWNLTAIEGSDNEYEAILGDDAPQGRGEGVKLMWIQEGAGGGGYRYKWYCAKSCMDKVVNPTLPPTLSPTVPPTVPPTDGTCSSSQIGHQRCSAASTYQTCDHGKWQPNQSCASGLTCSPSGNFIYCL